MLNKIYNNLDECVDYAFKLCSVYADEGVNYNLGGPFGACIIQTIDENKYKILAITRNTVLFDKDPTSHAEINAIRKASKFLDRFDLSDCILVTTSKSCPMCISAACWAKIKVVYYSQNYKAATTSGFKDNNILEYLQGKNDIITEKNKYNSYTEIPIRTWLDKQDKIIY
jgi:guanine deaminase